MTEENSDNEVQNEAPSGEVQSQTNEAENELTLLKAKADQEGIQYHPSIGLDNLKTRLNEKLATAPPPPAAPVQDEAGFIQQLANAITNNNAPANQTEVSAPPEDESDRQKRYRLKQEASALIRVRITCMNTNKKEWTSEIFTVGNSVVGTYTRTVPFNVDWHVEKFILNMIRSRKCQTFYTVTDPQTGRKHRKGKLINEFAVEILPALTQKQVDELAQRQAMSQGTAEAA